MRNNPSKAVHAGRTTTRVRIAFLLCLAILLPALNACATYIYIPIVKRVPDGYKNIMQGEKRVAIIAEPYKGGDLGGMSAADWTRTLQGITENTLRNYGYFDFVDLGSRKRREKELVFTQTGLSPAQKQIGRELRVQGFLFIEIPAQPSQDCTINRNTIYKKVCAREVLNTEEDKWECKQEKTLNIPNDEGVMFTTVHLRIKLVNIKTGKYVSHYYSAPHRMSRKSNCPSRLSAFSAAARTAARSLASRVSPEMTKLRVPVIKDTDGTPDNLAEQVETLLELGMNWAKAQPPNYEKAGEKWRDALQASGRTSAAAYWNLAVYYWYAGDMEKAEAYFKQASQRGHLIDSEKDSIIARFRVEKRRREQEVNAGEK